MKKTRILQVVFKMDRGGTEIWLMHVLRNIDRSKFEIDFLVHSLEVNDFEQEIFERGSKILRCSHPKKIWRYGRDLKKILVEHGPYDVVHTHGIIFDGIVLWMANKLKVPKLIIHSHNDISASLPSNIFKKIFIRWNMRLARHYATRGLACSPIAANSYFGDTWFDDPRWKVFQYGEDFSRFHAFVSIDNVRKQLDIPDEAFVIGHVGRFYKQKNHDFILKIANEAIKIDSNIFFIFVGDGPLRGNIMNLSKKMGISDNLLFTGVRSDIPELMLGAMDLFLFPSLYEGLGLVLVEAQAAGLPCVYSNKIPDEAIEIPGLVTSLPLSLPASEWANWIFKVKSQRKMISKQDALNIIENSKFNILNSISKLENIYQETK